jgi:hypothetical protein
MFRASSRCANGYGTRQCKAVMEPLERRTLHSMTTWTAPGISDLGAYCMSLEVRFGSNGWEGSDAVDGMVMSDALGEFEGAFTSWDSNLLDGLDSGQNDVYFSSKVAGSDQGVWSVGEFDTIGVHRDLCSGVRRVAVRAGVLHSGYAMEWSNVVVTFKRTGQVVQTVRVGGVSVDVCESPNDGAVESVVVVHASANDYDEVVVTGSVRMRGNVGLVPDPYDIFGQVLLYDTTA